MPLHLDHTIVPAHDKEASARFIARMFGLTYDGPWGPFAPVKVDEHLSLTSTSGGRSCAIITRSWPRTASLTRS